MTETSPVTLMTAMNETVDSSCGRVVPNTEMKVVDLETGEALGPGKRGELCARGPLVNYSTL